MLDVTENPDGNGRALRGRRSHPGRGAPMTALLDRARLPRSSDISRYTWFFAAFAYVLVMSVASTRMSWDIWAGIAFAPILFAVTIPLLKRGLRKDPDPRIGQLVVIAFVAKMFGAAARYALTYGLYERADASEYHESGARLATAFWDGDVGDRLAGRGARALGHPVHPPGHRPRLRRHQAHDLRRVRDLLVAELPRPVLLLQGHRRRLPRGQPPPVRVPRVLPPLDALLAVEHREGGVDLLRPRPRQLRRGPDPPPPTARLPRGRPRPARHRRATPPHHRAVHRRARNGLRAAAPVVERLDPRPGHQGRRASP